MTRLRLFKTCQVDFFSSEPAKRDRSSSMLLSERALRHRRSHRCATLFFSMSAAEENPSFFTHFNFKSLIFNFLILNLTSDLFHVNGERNETIG
jgi:hypothetical protein